MTKKQSKQLTEVDRIPFDLESGQSKEFGVQTEGMQQVAEGVQTEVRRGKDGVVQTEKRSGKDGVVQTDAVDEKVEIQTDSQSLQTSLNPIVCSQDIQTENKTHEREMQTAVKLATQRIQTEDPDRGFNQEIQVQTIFEYNPEQRTTGFQVSTKQVESSSQTSPPAEKKTREVSQYVAFKASQTTSYTQTKEEEPKKTRTGGVQVCIGNRMHVRQLKLAKVINRLSCMNIQNSQDLQISQIKSFIKWREIIKAENLRVKESFEEISKIDKFVKLCQNQQKSHLQNFIDKLKDNALRCMLYDQEKVAESQEKFSEFENEMSQMVKQNESLQNKQMYYEDLLEKKDKEAKMKKSEITAANKKIQELNRQIEDLKSRRRSVGNTSSLGNERKKRYGALQKFLLNYHLYSISTAA